MNQIDLGKGDVLIVDDILPNLRLLSSILMENGYKVRAVPNGSMALTAVRSAPPDLILLDINMPEMDGYEVCEELKKSGETKDIPVIFISALDEVMDKVKGFSAGGVDYITKPFQVEEVLVRIDTHLTLRKLQQELEESNATLEKRVAERTTELAGTVDTLEEQIEERHAAENQRRELETQLYQSQKMEALGRLAGGVTHDFNNILTVIIGFAEILISRCGNEEELRKRLEQINMAGQRASALTRQLLAFSRRQVFKPKVLNLNETVGSIEKMLTRLIGEDVALTIHLDSDLPPVKADPGQMDQVIMNLSVNARDAMPKGGELRIETAQVFVDHADKEGSAGAHVDLTVRDTGTGMDAETQARIFEPFYTTKKQGKGTGLGLSTVHGIVTQSGGHIQIESAPGKGTAFHICLPVETEAVSELETPRIVSGGLEGDETILLVEDDSDILDAMKQLIEDYGYDVITAEDAAEAVLACQRHEGNIELLIADVILPQVGGPELAKRLLGMRQNMKVLYMSGYLDESILNQGLEKLESAFLQKPFTQEQLLGTIREILDQK